MIGMHTPQVSHVKGRLSRPRKLLLLVLLALSLSACNDVQQTDLDINAMDSIGVTNKLVFKNKLAYLQGAKAPYSGVFTDRYNNGNKKTSVSYLRGLRHGLYQEWYPNGQNKLSMNFQQGMLQGEVLGWNKNGKPILHLVHVQGKITATLENAEQLYKLEHYAEALQLYLELAQHNNPKAQFLAGYMYNHGQGTATNAALAMHWYQKAAAGIWHKHKPHG